VTVVDVTGLLNAFGAGIRTEAGAIALYVGGSLATGDYQPGISDLDLAAIASSSRPAPQMRSCTASTSRPMIWPTLATST
jgi:hypothetical protein